MTAIAHIGHGYWGQNLARNFAELGVLSAVADADPAVAGTAANLHGVRVTTFEEAVADPAIAGVSLASPASLHYRQARAALEGGKHVYVEKPMALEVAQAEVLCDLAERRGLVLMVGHLLQYHPAYVKLREMVAAGELGRLLHAYSNRQSLGKFRGEENVLWSFAPHDISMVLGLFGQVPVNIAAQGQVAFLPGVADLATVQMQFPDGAGAHIQVSWMHPFKEQRLVVVGDKAMAVFEDSRPEWQDRLLIYRHLIDRSGPVPLPLKAEAERVVTERSEPLRNECRHFIQCIERGERPRTDGAEGLAVLRVLDIAERHLQNWLATPYPQRLAR